MKTKIINFNQPAEKWLSIGQGQTVLHSKSVADMHLIRQPNDCGYCMTLRSEGSIKQLLIVGSQVRCH